MAGTGHPYEVVNPAEAREAVLSGAGGGLPEAAALWLASAAVLRFATSPDFTVPVTREAAEECAAAWASDEAERAAIVAKAASGNVRAFVPDFLRHAGPDLSHIGDWLRALPEEDPRMLGKLPRLTVEAARRHADRWTVTAARSAAKRKGGGGRVRAVLELPGTGRAWFELLDGDALDDESAAMNHCVHTRKAAVASGSWRVFSLRDHRGRAYATLEAQAPFPNSTLGQVRSHSNAVPGPDKRADVLALIRSLGVVHDGYREAAAMGLALAADGTWREISEIGRRVSLSGMEGVEFENAVHLYSPLRPTEAIAVLRGPEGWMRGEAACAMFTAGDRRLRIEEIRALVALCNERKMSAMHVPGVVTVEGRFAPWADTCRKVDVDGTLCLVEPEKDGSDGRVHVARGADVTDILGHILLPSPRGERIFKAAREREAWTKREAATLAAAFTRYGVPSIYDHRSLMATGLERADDGRWVIWSDVSTRRETATAMADARDPHWQVAGWAGRLVGVRNRPLSYHCPKPGLVGRICASIPDRAVLEETGATLNALGLKAAPDYSDFPVEGPPTTSWSRAALGLVDEGAPRFVSVLAFVDGRWTVAAGEEGVLDLLKGAGRRQFADRRLNQFAIRMLPSLGSDPEGDRLLARHLGAWASWADRDGQAWPHSWSTDARDKGWLREGMVPRLQAAAALLDLMNPSERKAVIKLAVGFCRAIKGRKRRADYLGWQGEAVQAVVLAFGGALPSDFLDSSTRFFWRYDTFTEKRVEGGPRIPDVRWLDLADELGWDSRMRWVLREAADSALFRSLVLDGAGEAEAVVWTRTLTLAMGNPAHGVLRVSHNAREAVVLLKAAAEERGRAGAWDALAVECDRIAGHARRIDEERSAYEEKRNAEWAERQAAHERRMLEPGLEGERKSAA